MHGGSAALKIWEELIQFQTLPRHLCMIPGEKPPPSSFALQCPSCTQDDPTSALPLTTSVKQDIPMQPYRVQRNLALISVGAPKYCRKTNVESLQAVIL